MSASVASTSASTSPSRPTIFGLFDRSATPVSVQDIDIEAQLATPITPPSPARIHTPRAVRTSIEETTSDAVDDFFGASPRRASPRANTIASMNGTRESRHDELRLSAHADTESESASESMPPPYAECSGEPPAYSRVADQPTLAMYLFKFGFCEYSFSSHLPLRWTDADCSCLLRSILQCSRCSGSQAHSSCSRRCARRRTGRRASPRRSARSSSRACAARRCGGRAGAWARSSCLCWERLRSCFARFWCRGRERGRGVLSFPPCASRIPYHAYLHPLPDPGTPVFDLRSQTLSCRALFLATASTEAATPTYQTWSSTLEQYPFPSTCSRLRRFVHHQPTQHTHTLSALSPLHLFHLPYSLSGPRTLLRVSLCVSLFALYRYPCHAFRFRFVLMNCYELNVFPLICACAVCDRAPYPAAWWTVDVLGNQCRWLVRRRCSLRRDSYTSRHGCMRVACRAVVIRLDRVCRGAQGNI